MDAFETTKEYIELRIEQLNEIIEKYETYGGPKAAYDVAVSAQQALGDVYIKMLFLTKRPKIEDLGKGF